MKHFLIYTGLRIALFLACWGVALGIVVPIFGAGRAVGAWAFVAAVVISSVLSLKVLAGPRERFAASVEARAARAAERFEEMKSTEDVD